MTYVIGYKNDAMANPTIVYGPFSTLVQAINSMPKSNIESYKVYQLIEVTHKTDSELKESIEELYKG